MRWWEKEPLRLVEIGDGLDFSAIALEKEVEAVKRLGGNVQHFHCMLHSANEGDTAGLNDRRFFFETKLAKKNNPDRLRAYLPLAHKRGIRVIVYFNVHWYSQRFGKEHSDWLQLKEDSKPMDDVYTTGTSFCINSGYREWVFQILRDLCNYEIDGILYDGPIFFDKTCYCEECRRIFRRKTGAEVPPKSNRQHPLWKRLIDFQAESLGRFLADSDTIIKKINPEVLLYMNGNSNWPYWPTGRDNHQIIKHTDMLIAEGGFLYNDLNQTPVYKPAMCAKLLVSQARGKPAFSANCVGHKPWSWYPLPAAEISLMFAETLASGTTFWTAVFPDDLSQPELKVITSYNQLIKDNPVPFFQTKSLSKVALVWPSHSVEVYAGSTVPLTDFTKEVKAESVGDIDAEFTGFYEGLSRAQVPFDVIDEENFNNLSRYELLFLPNASCLSPASVEMLKMFVRNGGNLVASFETSLYDEAGKKKKDFQLEELFGCNFAGSIFGPLDWDYISPAPRRGSYLLKDITKKFLPAPTYGVQVKLTTGRVLLYFCGRLAGCYEHPPKISEQPFLVLNRLGKGNILYLAGTLGLSLGKFRFPEYLLLFKNICSEFSSSLVTIESAPRVEVSLREKGEQIFLHLINQTSGLKRPLTSFHPLLDLRINLFLNKKVTQANALRTEKRLELKKVRTGISLVLPHLNDYEIIALQ